MTDRTEPNAIVLPVAAATAHEAQGFPGMPGRYMPGEPVLLRTVELTLEEARSLIADLGVPLELVDHGKKREVSPVADENPPRVGSAPGETPAADLTPVPPTEDAAPAAAPVAAKPDTDGGSK